MFLGTLWRLSLLTVFAFSFASDLNYCQAEESNDSALHFFAPKLYEQIQEAMHRRYDVNFKDVSLNKVVSSLSDLGNVPMWVDEDAATKAGLKLDSSISICLPTVSFSSALTLILAQFDLDYTFKHEVIYITTKSDVRSTNLPFVYRIQSGFVVDDVAALIEKEANSLQGAFNDLPPPVVQTLRRSDENDKSVYLYVKANRYTHQAVEKALKMLD